MEIDDELFEEFLMHFGVLGMKWGQRRAANGSQIRTARRNLKAKRKAYSEQKSKVSSAGNSETRHLEKKKLDKMGKDYDNDPDRVIASRMTRGEKAAVLLLLSPPVGIGAIIGSSAKSRRLEYVQDKREGNN